MVNNSGVVHPPRSLGTVISVYVVNVVAALVALAVLSALAPRQATQDAWVHSVVVAVLAGVLVLRLRAAQAGRRSGLRAVGLVCAVLFVANVVLALAPGFLPDWLRLDAVLVAGLMLAAIGLVVRTALARG